MTRLEPGMSRSQVEHLLGRPDGYSQEGGIESLRYSNRFSSGWAPDRGDYFVALQNGRVVKYGAEEIRPGPRPVLFLHKAL